MVMMVGATPGLGGASEDGFEAIGQHGDKEWPAACCSPKWTQPCGAALGA